MKEYMVVYYNRTAQQIQTYQVSAISVFRAGRAFYKKHNRKGYRGSIQTISEIKT